MSDLPPPSTPAKGSPVISTPCPTPLFPSAFSRLSQPRSMAKQLEEASVGELPPNLTIEDLPKVVWKNRRFVQEDSLARKADATRRVGQNSSQYKRHLLQQIIFAKPIGSPQRVNQAPATIARSISSPMQPPNDHGLTRA
ncbi:hypothetical protein BFJ69_g18417 [Fusarium oxysporum]|uniref:Uncharacterized protein n=1 Tax=Fusarium oxysporum TaxID=5507 RepID=A0A420M5G9_FUSOX|nr:hypothetical protein BFJ69_g18417 [Fusarium oxysporum]